MARESNGSGNKSKAQRIAEDVARAVGAGRAVELETVDFGDPKRPKTCLEVDFPILPVNQVAIVEGNASKPIYQLSKWWARRRSSVFRSLLLSASMKAPDDPSQAAKAVWDVYYANHQKKRSFANIRVADIFMGGGTTVVEGNRLGMQMIGNDLNPVAWFVVKTELATVKKSEVEALLAEVEAEVKPQIMPFYACRGPHGESGTWTQLSTGQVMNSSFDPLAVKPEDRKDFSYKGPEIICVFWAKHGPCQFTGCGHRTPVMGSPLIAMKELTVKAWPHTCRACRASFDIEDCEARMAPDAPLALAAGEPAFAVLNKNGTVSCPACKIVETFPALGKATKKKVVLSLLVHPQWLYGAPSKDDSGNALGGSVTDDAESSARWYSARGGALRLLEVRGLLPSVVTCPETKIDIKTDEDGGTKAFETKKDGSRGYIRSSFACGKNGHRNDVLDAIKASGKSGPAAPYALQGYSAALDAGGAAYGGRFFAGADSEEASRIRGRP